MPAALRSAVTLAAITLALGSVGCSFTSTCNSDKDDSTEIVADGLVYGNTYISAPNDGEHRGPFKHFPPAHTLVFEHHLGSVPYQVEIWLAFSESGSLAPTAGNSALEKRRDKDAIQIMNDTCSEFYAWVQASVPVYSDLGTAGASGADPLSNAGAAGSE